LASVAQQSIEAGVHDFRVVAKQLRFHLDHRLLGI
jgi:hypothetical protein